jgi:hypothetical protein
VLSTVEATVLATALATLRELDSRWSRAAYGDELDAVRRAARLAESAGTAKDVLQAFLISVHVYGESRRAESALDVSHGDES